MLTQNRFWNIWGVVVSTAMFYFWLPFIVSSIGFLVLAPFTVIFITAHLFEGIPIERFNRAHVESECTITSMTQYPQWCTTSCIYHIGPFCAEYNHSICYSYKLTAKHSSSDNVTIYASPHSPLSQYMVGTTFTCYYNENHPWAIQMNLKYDDTKVLMRIFVEIEFVTFMLAYVFGTGLWFEKLIHRHREDSIIMLSKEV